MIGVDSGTILAIDESALQESKHIDDFTKWHDTQVVFAKTSWVSLGKLRGVALPSGGDGKFSLTKKGDQYLLVVRASRLPKPLIVNAPKGLLLIDPVYLDPSSSGKFAHETLPAGQWRISAQGNIYTLTKVG